MEKKRFIIAIYITGNRIYRGKNLCFFNFGDIKKAGHKVNSILYNVAKFLFCKIARIQYEALPHIHVKLPVLVKTG